MTKEDLLTSFWSWAKTVFTDSYRQEVQSYLNESIDFADLENKIKLLKIRGLF